MTTHRRYLLDAIRSRGRLALVCLMLASYLGTAIGFPVVTTTSDGKDTTRSFFCQGRTCGCKSAQQCWNRCCCSTQDQRLAWARRNDVAPPSRLAASPKQPVPKSAACCEKGTKTADKEGMAKMRVKMVIGSQLLACSGLSTSWTAAADSLPPPVANTPNCSQVVVGWLDLIDDQFLLSRLAPAVPPPRA